MDAALSTTVDGLRSTGKRIKKGNDALSDAMRNAYDEVNLLDPARQIGLTSQGRGDPSIMRSINTPLVAGAQMGLGAANAAYRGTANLLGQGVEGVRSALPKSLSDYVGTGAQFERDFNAMPEFLAGTGFGLIPGVGPRLAGGFTEGTAARNAERGMVKLTDNLPMDEASRMGRADEMFPEKGYFGRNNDFSSFDNGHWIADDPKIAGHYAKRAWAKDELSHADDLDGGEFTDVDNINPYDLETSYTPSAENIIPLRYNKGKTLSLEHLGDNPTLESLFDDLSKKGIVDKPSVNELDDLIDETDLTTDSALWRKIQELGIDQDIRKAGYDSYSITDAVVAKNGTIPHRSTFVFDPKKSRSRFAKFDPAKKDSGDLLAGVLPLSAFLGDENDTPFDRLKRKFKGAK